MVGLKYKTFEYFKSTSDPKYKKGDRVYYHGSYTSYHGYFIIDGDYWDTKHHMWKYYLRKDGKYLSNLDVLRNSLDNVWETSISLTEEEGIIKNREFHDRQESMRGIDPYLEEVWESHHKSQGKLSGKYVRFTFDIEDDENRRKTLVKKNVPYQIQYFNGVDYIINGEFGRFEIDPFYVEGEDFFVLTQKELDDRRKLWLEKHPDDPYCEEIWESHENDPYDEERWDDDIIYEFQEGDTVISSVDGKDGKGWVHHKGLEYTIVKKWHDELFIVTTDRYGYNNFYDLRAMRLNFIKKQNEKYIFETMNPDDPYNEEKWDGELDEPDFGEDFDENDIYDRMLHHMGECRVCGRYAPNDLMLDNVCRDCREEQNHCSGCGSYVPKEFLEDGLCSSCKNDPGWSDNY